MPPLDGFYGLFCGDGRRPSVPDAWRRHGLRSLTPCLWLGAGRGQPEAVVCVGDSRWLAYHGMLHNRAELAARLGLPGEVPLDALLLAAWANWPDDWTRRLDGVWVVAHGQLNSGTISLRRDPSGALGLFYRQCEDGGLAFACRLDALTRPPARPPRPAPPGLHEYLRLLDVAAPNTIYERIQAVPPGEGIELSVDGAGRMVTLSVHGHSAALGDVGCAGHERFPLPPRWRGASRAAGATCTVTSPALVGRPLSEAAATDELGRCLTQAIGRRLEGVERPAAFLSGGVDSALICALAARQRPDLTAITVGFEGVDYDESPVASAIARHLGIRHEVLRFGRDALVQALALAGGRAEQPMADPALPVTLLAFDWAKGRFDAVLDGTGADELVGAMPPRHLRVAVEWGARLPTGLRRRIARGLGGIPRLASYRPVFDFEHPAEPLMRWHGFRREEIEALTGQAVSLEQTRFCQVFRRFPPSAHYERYSALLETLPCERLTQAMLITGLDVRFPYWNPEVEALLRGLPRDLRWRPESPKHILRALLARHVPQGLWDAPKHGFDFPLHEFLTAEDFRLVRRYLLEADWKRWELLSAEGVAGYARRFMAGEPGLTFRVWALVVLAAWLEGHGY